MRRIRTSRLDVAWLQGPGPADLWTWHDGQGGVRAQELTFFGHTVVAKPDQVTTGVCHDDGGPAFLGKAGLLDFDPQLDAETLAAAARLLAAVPDAVRGADVDALTARIHGALAGLPDAD